MWDAQKLELAALHQRQRVRLKGSVLGGTDTVTLTTVLGGNIILYAANNNSIINLAQNWSGAEF